MRKLLSVIGLAATSINISAVAACRDIKPMLSSEKNKKLVEDIEKDFQTLLERYSSENKLHFSFTNVDNQPKLIKLINHKFNEILNAEGYNNVLGKYNFVFEVLPSETQIKNKQHWESNLYGYEKILVTLKRVVDNKDVIRALIKFSIDFF